MLTPCKNGHCQLDRCADETQRTGTDTVRYNSHPWSKTVSDDNELTLSGIIRKTVIIVSRQQTTTV